jgi:hypothetical protein
VPGPQCLGQQRRKRALSRPIRRHDHVHAAGAAGDLAVVPAGLEVQGEAGAAQAGGGDGDEEVVLPAEAGLPVDLRADELDVEAGVELI